MSPFFDMNRFHSTLILVRLIVALTSTSTIHPDEWFQNSEIAASLVWSYAGKSEGPLRTWEWEGTRPCRSVVPVWTTTGVVFRFMRQFTAGEGRRF